ncbi:MAG: M24 family metallopeptidase [Candidatus Omnitrophica bacterium]|nr:M24 family metallopeptidase [Candidatus Omnitrophota bacterium]
MDRIEKIIKQVARKIADRSVDAFLVSDQKDLLYISGFSVPGAMALLFPDKPPVYFIDGMNFSLAEEELCGTPFSDPVRGDVRSNLAQFCSEAGIARLGIDPGALTKKEADFFSDRLDDTEFVDLSGFIAAMRSVKSGSEIVSMRRSARLASSVWKKLRGSLCAGMTEIEIASLADMTIRETGCVNSFPTIAATGPNSSFPHAVPTRRKLGAGEHLLVDFGLIYNGYCSDLTRIYYKGRINRQIGGFLKAVRKARDEAIARIRPGVMISTVAAHVNNIIKEEGFGPYLLHGLGHGLGLEVHERPYIGISCRERFRKGMVVTVEPGLYLKGLGGVRIEDMVLVTAKGCEVLS